MGGKFKGRTCCHSITIKEIFFGITQHIYMTLKTKFVMHYITPCIKTNSAYKTGLFSIFIHSQIIKETTCIDGLTGVSAPSIDKY